MKIRELIRKKLKESEGVDKMLILYLNGKILKESEVMSYGSYKRLYFSVFSENVDRTIAQVEISNNSDDLLKYNKPIFSLEVEPSPVEYVESYCS